MSILDEVADIEQPVCTFITAVRTYDEGTVEYMAGHNGDSMPSRHRRIAGDPAVLHVYTGSFASIRNHRTRQVVIAKSKPEPGENDETFEWVFTGPADEAWTIFYAHAAMLPALP